MSVATPIARCALFDIDGTLIDTVESIVGALHDTYRKHLHIDVPRDDIRASIGLPLKTQVRMYDHLVTTRPDHAAMERDTLTHYERRRHLERPFEGAVAALRALHRAGCVTGLVTSKNAIECAEFLPRFDLLPYVQTAVNSSDTHHPKPYPDPVLEAMRRLGVAPQETVFIGDTVYDIECGQAAGVRVVAVTWGAHPAEMLRAANPWCVVEQPEELETLLLRYEAIARR